MAIQKNIEMTNGITLKYHRIVAIKIITNHAINIEICSYLDKTARDKEKNTERGQQLSIYTETEFVTPPYTENYSISEAYEYLKQTEKYSGGTDV